MPNAGSQVADPQIFSHRQHAGEQVNWWWNFCMQKWILMRSPEEFLIDCAFLNEPAGGCQELLPGRDRMARSATRSDAGREHRHARHQSVEGYRRGVKADRRSASQRLRLGIVARVRCVSARV